MYLSNKYVIYLILLSLKSKLFFNSRRVLTRMGAGNLANSLIPETMDNCLSYSVLNYLKRLKNQAKLEFDKTLSTNSAGSSKNPRHLDGIKVLARSPLKRDLLMNHLIKDKFMSVREQLTDFPGFQINIKDQLPPLNGFRNAYDIERKDLLDQVYFHFIYGVLF